MLALRNLANRIYQLSYWLAAALLVAILLTVLIQVGLTLIDKAAGIAGLDPPGWFIPSYAEFTGYFRGLSCWLALTIAFKSGSHIRISLLVRLLSDSYRRMIELVCLAICGAVTGAVAYYTGRLTIDSFRFGDVSSGLVAVPVWIFQCGLTFGFLVMTLAAIEEFIRVLSGSEPAYGYEERNYYSAGDGSSEPAAGEEAASSRSEYSTVREKN